MSHVFISYSRESRPYTRALAAYLLKNGFDIWIDDRIEYGENWWHAIVEAIKTCAACMVIMTPDSEQSTWVEREVALAEQLGKPMFPLLLEGGNWPLFVLTHYVDVTDGSLPGSSFIKRLAEVVPRKAAEGYDPANLAGQYYPTPQVSPEQQRLLEIMLDPQYPPQERAEAGRKLALLGDPRPGVGLRADGLPDIDWAEVPEGGFIYQNDERLVLPTFWIARYPITYKQFQAFIDAEDGFHNPECWNGLDAPDNHKVAPNEQTFKFWNHPRENVSWWDAVAFCQWLSAQLGYDVTLPNEQQWEKAARGTRGQKYPYAGEFDPNKGNTCETGIKQTSAVGIFTQGASPYEVLDMSGNVWEWCLNMPDGNTVLSSSAERVSRGGSWYNFEGYARCTYRLISSPTPRYSSGGIRVCARSRPN